MVLLEKAKKELDCRTLVLAVFANKSFKAKKNLSHLKRKKMKKKKSVLTQSTSNSDKPYLLQLKREMQR